MQAHIAIFLPSLRGGGAERTMMMLANAFVDRGLDVDLVLAKAEGPYLEDVTPSVRIIDLHAGRVAFSLVGLIKYLRRERPNILLSALNYANVVALCARAISRVPSRCFVSERAMLSISTAQASSLRTRFLPHVMRLVYPRADGVIAVSHGVADDLSRVIGLPRDKVDVIYNPVVGPDLFAKASEPVEHPWFAPGEPPVVLGVGRLTEAKDWSTLINAFASLRKTREARLVILGEGRLRSDLQRLVLERGLSGDVAFPGFVDNPFAWMRRSALFVLSSAWEGLPGVLVQAMACGTRVVSTDCPSGPAEILENGRWGRLVPVGDIAALADAMGAALDDPEPPDVRSRAEAFRIEHAVDMHLALLQPNC